MLFERIISGPTKREENLNFLKHADCAIVILGIAAAAKWTAALLKNAGIGIDGYCVTDNFWKPGLNFGDLPVRSLSDTLAHFGRVVVIPAVGSRDELKKELSARPQVVACPDFDCPTVAEICDREQLAPRREALETLYDRLADDFSRRTMTAFINARISGDAAYLREVDRPAAEQYFSDCIAYSRNEIVMDCGAYIGDTLEAFLKNVGAFARYFAFECDPNNFRELDAKFGGRDDVVPLPCGVSDSERVAHMDFDGGSDARVSECGKHTVRLTTIDHVLAEYESGCTFIKMDVEGAELAALRGARETIRRHRPKLAICVYHKAEDLWTIPQYILSLDPGYKLYLRKYMSPFSCELVLYAI